MAPPSTRRHVKPPPDYFSRRVQVKVLMLVGTLMLVIVLMFEARKPENWRWMWQLESPPSTELAPQDTRPILRPEEASRSEGPLLVEPSVVNLSDVPKSLGDLQQHGWRLITSGLNSAERRLLRDALRAAGKGNPIAAADAEAWNALVDRVDGFWNDHHDQTFTAMARNTSRLSDEERRMWLTLLEENRQAWPDLKVVLESIASRQLDTQERDTLAGLQSILDGLALDRVRDDTVFRTEDREAWFRLFERLSAIPADDINLASSGPATFVQLFGQPQVYRGRLVTISGQVRLAYRLAAPKNEYGVDRYYAMWLRPAEGGDSPIAVYCLELPPGFPEVKDRDLDGETTTLSEDVRVTGYFFKRLVYASTSGANTAPLVIARQPVWLPVAERPIKALPVAQSLVWATIIIVLAACGTAWWVFRWSPGRQAAKPSVRLNAFDEQAVMPGPRERLGEISDGDSTGEGA